jgi:hypothetical protein
MILRRSFLLGIGATMAAPAIVRASSLMPVRSVGSLIETISAYPGPEMMYCPWRVDANGTIWMRDSLDNVEWVGEAIRSVTR